MLQYKYNAIYEISPDSSLIIGNISNLSYWYYSANNLFFINSGYLCLFNFFTHKTDTISFSNFARSFIYKPNAIYLLDDTGIWKNNILLVNGSIKNFAVGKNGSLFLLKNDTLYFNKSFSLRDSVIDTHITSFCITKPGKVIYLKNDTLLIDGNFIAEFKYIPQKLYAIKNRIIIYAKDSIFTFDY
ncbi:MAG: hypothetical protein GWP03_04400 [Proteobacteria bacterium]|nr:hypothetical protein [Pseudomonadota bacterium]